MLCCFIEAMSDLYHPFKKMQATFHLEFLFPRYLCDLCITNTPISSACLPLTKSLPKSWVSHIMLFLFLCMNCLFFQTQADVLKSPSRYSLCFVCPAYLLFTQWKNCCVLMWAIQVCTFNSMESPRRERIVALSSGRQERALM